MSTALCPERVKSQKLVAALAEGLGSALTPESARRILELELEELPPSRLEELAAKANEGLLTIEERAEYGTYAQIRGMLAILQSKARLHLRQPGAA
jgi:hypothetical protein